MLPDYLVPAKYHITPVEQQPTEAEKEASFTQGKRKLSDFEPDILIGVSELANPEICCWKSTIAI